MVGTAEELLFAVVDYSWLELELWVWDERVVW